MAIRLACVVGARPNFMKMAPLIRALKSGSFRERADVTLIHTGQHYDPNLSDIFFAELGMPAPHIALEVGSGSHAVQTARILEQMERVLLNGPPSGGAYDVVVVVGDVNSTLAAALAGAKLGIRIAHVEAGLRSFDRTMPEEINRIVTDSIAELLFVSEPVGVDNLIREGHPDGHIKLVGNVMIDTLYYMLAKAKELAIVPQLGLRPREYGVITMHRPSNVDNKETLSALVEVLVDISNKLPFVFPVHPRTANALARAGLRDQMERIENLFLLEPLGYLAFLSLTSQARVIVTDSGGLQEESTALGIPCLTLRKNTERPITVDMGTSTLIGNDAKMLRTCLQDVINDQYKSGTCPELWDGHAAERIARVLVDE
jgi:UDP-N-acetylglucosamine 2-epimerase (non-hydrolysing)